LIAESWAFSREAIAAGEVWRLAGASAAHLSWAHLAGNLAVFAAALHLLCPVARAAAVIGVLAASALATTAGLYLGTSLDWYVGASGAVYGLLAWGAMRLPMPAGAWLLLLLMANVAVDQGRATSWLGEPLAPQSHYWGLACGLALAIVSGWRALASPLPSMAPRISDT
jgi:rhomboid family GlyGly-CTERM serine protease